MFQSTIRPATETREEYPLFDWLRLALASTVALHHENLIPWEQSGNFAVQVFFALSGWLIGGILLKTDNLPKFYYNRATRIWIPYALAVVAIYGLAAIHEGIDSTWWRCLFFDGTFTHNWFIDPTKAMPLQGTGAHFWSIAVEEQFYLAAPLLLAFSRSVRFWMAVAFIAVLSGSWYGSISLGVLAAVAKPKIDTRLLLSLALVLAAMVIVDYTLFAPPLALCVVLLTSRQGQRTKWGEFAGGISYPMYLYHWTGMFAANAIGNRLGFTAGRGWLAFVFALIAGTIAYLIVDRNVMRLRGRYFTQTRGRILMATAYGLLGAGVIYGCSAAI